MSVPVRQGLVMPPVLLGEGEALFPGVNLAQLGVTSVNTVAGENAMHIIIKKG